MPTLAPFPKFVAMKTTALLGVNIKIPLVGGKLWSYAAGTTTPKDTYETDDLAETNTNPVILDARGEANVWLGLGAYKFLLTDAADVTQPGWPVDNIRSVEQLLLEGDTLLRADLADTADADKGSGMVWHNASLTHDPGTIGALLEPDVCAFPWLADRTGVVDCTSAVNAAFAAGVTKFPAGTFKLSGSITTVEAQWANVRGAGKGKTFLKFSSGGLRVPMSGFTSYHATTVQGMTIMTSQAVVGTVGLRIYKGTTQGEFTVRMSDLEIGGADGVHGDGTNPLGPSKWWDIAIQLDGVRFVHWDDLMLYGGNPDKSTAGIDILAPTDNSNPGFHYAATNFSISSFQKGVRVNGWIEGIYWSNFEIFACRDAMTGNHVGTGALVLGTWLFSNGHMNASRDCFTSNGTNNIGFVNMSLNRGVVENVSPTSYAGDILRIENADADGEVFVSDSRLFNAFTNQGSFIALTNVQRVVLSGLSCYGGTSTNLFALGQNTDNVMIDNVFCDTAVGTVLQLGGNTGTGAIEYNGLVVPNYTAFRADVGDKLGKYISSFSAFVTAALSNVTGDGAFYTPAGWTELYDNGGLLNAATGQVTVRVSGWYAFDFTADFSGLVAGHVDANVYLVATPGGNHRAHGNAYAMSTGGYASLSVHAEVYLARGEVMNPTIMVSGGAKVVGLLHTTTGTRFSGRLLKQG